MPPKRSNQPYIMSMNQNNSNSTSSSISSSSSSSSIITKEEEGDDDDEDDDVVDVAVDVDVAANDAVAVPFTLSSIVCALYSGDVVTIGDSVEFC